MSKDKAGKKDKWKHLDLFDMMLKQSQVFRDMVEQFQSAWVPQAPSVEIEASVSIPTATRKPAKTAKAAPVAAPAKGSTAKKAVASRKAGAKKAVASTKPALAPGKPSARKTSGKAAATRRVVKKK